VKGVESVATPLFERPQPNPPPLGEWTDLLNSTALGSHTRHNVNCWRIFAQHLRPNPGRRGNFLRCQRKKPRYPRSKHSYARRNDSHTIALIYDLYGFYKYHKTSRICTRVGMFDSCVGMFDSRVGMFDPRAGMFDSWEGTRDAQRRIFTPRGSRPVAQE